MLAYGASKIIIGTAANEEFLSKLPKDKVIVAIDSKKGKVTTEGWTKEVSETRESFYFVPITELEIDSVYYWKVCGKFDDGTESKFSDVRKTFNDFQQESAILTLTHSE